LSNLSKSRIQGQKSTSNEPFFKRIGGFCSKVYNLMFHGDVYYRLGGVLILGLLLFLVSWAVFMFLVNKPNMFSNTFMIKKLWKIDLVKSFGPWKEADFQNILFWKIKTGNFVNVILLTFKYFVNQLIFVIPFIFALNLFKIGRYNLSVFYFALYTIFWGAVAGTNSFSFPVGTNVVMGTLILYARYGLWLWFSYAMLLVSTTQFSWLAAPSWTSPKWEKERKFWPVSFTPDQLEIFIYGFLFLLAACFAEAQIYVHYNGIS
jgi:hypothetical protein